MSVYLDSLNQVRMSPQVLKGHTSDVTGCDFLDDHLATCSADKTVRVWKQRVDGEFVEAEYSPLRSHTYGVNCVRFSTYSSLLASGSTDGRTILWEVQNGKKLGEVQHSSGSPIRACCFSPSSPVLATAGDDEKVVLWDVSTMAILRTFEGHEAMVTSLAFTPDGAFLLSCSTAEDLLLWDGACGHGKSLASVNNAHDLGILACDFSPVSVEEERYTLATCGNDDLVKVWSVSARDILPLRTLEGHSGNVMACRFSNDGMLLASGFVTCCAFSNDGHLASGSNDKTVNVWTATEEGTQKKKKSGKSREPPYSLWSVDEVLGWLTLSHLDALRETFAKHHIDGKELMNLNHDTLLTALKIESFGQRSKVLHGIQCLRNPLWQHVLSSEEGDFPEFCCPITHQVMCEPVVAADGHTYERGAIEEWFKSGKKTSPMTNEDLSHLLLIPNLTLLQLMHKFKHHESHFSKNSS